MTQVTYPCGLHMGPGPVPEECPACIRIKQAEAERPPVKGYGVHDALFRARRVRAENGRMRAGAHHENGNVLPLPPRRKGLTFSELATILRDAGRKKKEIGE